ncbi:hypothetical protein LTR08_007659 [Meristemomyces frigidus]|nr:hypothetical protein LTR08_007659 [Meristemomyces frigidus]
MASSERGSMSHGIPLRDPPQQLGGTNITAEVARTMSSILKRCVQCPDTTPSCPSCKHNQICSLVPSTCDVCQYATCIANPSPAPSSSGPNVGAIAGGVIGGVLAVAVVVFFVWRFWIKKRREQQELEAEEWEDDDIAQQKATHQFNAMHTDAASTRTRGSLANSFLSRASNIIQIAYIPGVTNRNGSGHNSLLSAAPVPPIPAAMRGQPPKSPLSNEGDMLFFRPGDLRDSSYSATSSLQSGNRDTQYSRRSITPSLARSSMVSEVYRDDAPEVPMPAQTVARVAPRMVSVKSSASGSPSESSGTKTPVSEHEYSQFAANTPAAKGKNVQIVMPGQGERPSDQGPYVKAKQVTVGTTKGRFPVRNLGEGSPAASTISRHAPNISSPLAEIDDNDEDAEQHTPSRRSPTNSSSSRDMVSPPLIQPVESPFFDASEHFPASASNAKANPYATMGKTIGTSMDDRPKRGGRMNALSDIIEEATRRASRVPSHEGLGGIRDLSPFSDSHATG